MHGDAELLRLYVEEGSERAFTDLVDGHFGLVYSAALRRVNGDAGLAEDVCQEVFTTLALSARSLRKHPVLSGWLYVKTAHAAATALRAEQRRRARELEFTMANANSPSDPADLQWSRVRPELDAIMDRLPEPDRNALLLRFFENRSFGEVGAALRVSDDAARMRVDRALARLCSLLERRGVRSSSAALGALLTEKVMAVPAAGVAARIAGTALGNAASAGSAASGALGWLTLMSTTKVAVSVAGVLGVLGIGSLLLRSSSPEGRQQSVASARAGREPGPSISEPSPVAPLAVPEPAPIAGNTADLAAAFAQLRAAPKSVERDDQIKLLLKRWGELDPQSALQSVGASDIVDAIESARFHAEVLGGWARRDPAAAWAWLIDGPLPELQTTGRPRGHLRVLSEATISEAIEQGGHFTTWADLLTAPKPPDLEGYFFNALGKAWGLAEPAAAAAWIEKLPPGLERRGALSGFAEGVALENRELAVSLLQSRVDPVEKSTVANSIMKTFTAKRDYAGGLGWLNSLGGDNADGAYDNAYTGLLSSAAFSKSYPVSYAETVQLIGRIRSPQFRTMVAKDFVQLAKSESPADAMQAVMRYYPAEAQEKELQAIRAKMDEGARGQF